MLWAVWHEWPSGAQFTFNCYRHWAILVVNKVDRSGYFLHSKEGMAQGDPLAKIAYGIGVLPLRRELQGAQSRVTQRCYVDDAGEGGKFPHILPTFMICRRGVRQEATTRADQNYFGCVPA